MGDKTMEETRYKILLIEDNKLDQTAFMRMVEDEKLPYDCTIAGSVSEALSALGSEQFDIVISDYMLGDGTAFDILESVKNTPIVLTTACGDEEVVVKAWKAGADDYLTKDLERNYLRAVPVTVENVIRHKKIKEQVQLLSGAIMSTDDSVYITNMENKIIFVNKSFCKTYGYSKEEVVGKDSNILWMGRPQSENTRSVFQIAGGGWQVGFYHKRKDGSIFPVSLSRSIIKDPSGNEVAVVGVARDISDRVLVEDELRAANQKLKEQNQLKDELAIAISEELRRPLAVLNNIICDAKAGAPGEISPKLKENLESAEQEINRARRIVNDFLDISNIDAGKMNLELSELSLRSVVCEVVEALSSLAAEKDIELEALLPDSEPTVNADYNRIVQVLSNLIRHSIKSTPSNGHVWVRVKDVNNEIIVEVQDDGPSIKIDEMNKIFERSARIKELGGWRQEEPALGLPIAKELVEMHGGHIWAKSEDGQGNIFGFSLPKADIQKEVAPVAAASSNPK
jgi:PAS domain S-box-containing protein